MISTTNLNQSPNIKHNTNPLPKGFTIIEVVLVLAIAGLIFLMVFIALPALQRNQRDTQRKNDISRLQDAIERYKANNRGQLPWAESSRGQSLDTNNFGNNYLRRGQGEWSDPSGINYVVSVNNISIFDWPGGAEGWTHPGYRQYLPVNIIFIFISYKCKGAQVTAASGSTNYAIVYALEGGGSVCVDG